MRIIKGAGFFAPRLYKIYNILGSINYSSVFLALFITGSSIRVEALGV